MAVTAKELCRSGGKGRALHAIVSDQLLLIDERLRGAATAWGRNSITVNLPIQFSCPGFGKKDSQRIIYSMIIRSLRERGFEVRILLERMRTLLYVEWVADVSPGEVAAMNRLIQEAHITAPELSRLSRGGAKPRAGPARRPERRGGARPPERRGGTRRPERRGAPRPRTWE